jgi:hypothetical protein
MVEGRWCIRIRRGQLRRPLPPFQENELLRTKYDSRRFVTVWQASTSMDEVASAMGMTRLAVQSFAAKLRRSGVPLKRFYSQYDGEEIDFAELKAIAEASL